MPGSSVQAGPLKALPQPFGGLPSAWGLRHQYQSRFGLVSDDFDSWNQACSSLVWFTTRSITIFRPRSWASASSRSNSARLPKTGSMSW